MLWLPVHNSGMQMLNDHFACVVLVESHMNSDGSGPVTLDSGAASDLRHCHSTNSAGWATEQSAGESEHSWKGELPATGTQIALASS